MNRLLLFCLSSIFILTCSTKKKIDLHIQKLNTGYELQILDGNSKLFERKFPDSRGVLVDTIFRRQSEPPVFLICHEYDSYCQLNLYLQKEAHYIEKPITEVTESILFMSHSSNWEYDSDYEKIFHFEGVTDGSISFFTNVFVQDSLVLIPDITKKWVIDLETLNIQSQLVE